MTYLYIEQGSNVEVVTAQMLLKLYEIASSNGIETCVLKGNLLSQHCYDYVYNYLTGKISADEYRFPDLFLNITDGVYMSFVDPVIANYWINSSYGDGTGITNTTAQSVTTFPKRLTALNLAVGNKNEFNSGQYAFYNDQTITSFNELGRFTNITSIPTSMFRGSSLQSIDLSNVTNIEAAAFAYADLTGVVNIPKLTTWGGRTNSTSINMDNQYFCSNVNMTEINIGSLVPVALRFTELKPYIFRDCTSLTKVTGLDNVTNISILAFKNCSNLVDIDVDPSKLTSIYTEAFRGCTSFTSLDLSNVTEIGSQAFDGSGLSGSINLSSIVNISSGAFAGCNGITSCTIGPNVSRIDNSIFRNCKNLQTVVLPNTLHTLDSHIFNGCSNLTSIDISNITSIGYACFLECTSWLATLDLSNVTSLGGNVFYKDTGVVITNLPKLSTLPQSAFTMTGTTSVVIPKETLIIDNGCFQASRLNSISFESGTQLTTINNGVFDGTLLLTITIPEGVTTLGNSVFNNCKSLVRADLPSTITSIGSWAFQYADLFTTCICRATTPPTLGTSAFNFGNWRTKLSIYVPDASVNSYKAAANWSTYASVIKGISQLPNS